MTAGPDGGTTVGAMRYPEAPRLDLVEDLHGHRVADPYRWLEDDADPRTEAWSGAPDALAVHAALSDARCRLDPVMQAVERPAEAIPAS